MLESWACISIDRHSNYCPAAAARKTREMASDPNLTISVHENLESLEPLRPEWSALLSEYPYSTTFSTYEWLASWWRAFGGGDKLLVLAFREAAPSATLVGLAPLTVTMHKSFPFRLRMLRLMGDGSHDSDNLDLPVKPGFEERFAESLLHFLESKRHAWDFAELNTMPPQSPGAKALQQALARRNWEVVENQRPASAIPLPGTWEEYLSSLSAKERGKIGLRTRRLEKRYEVRIQKCVAEGELNLFLGALYELHGKHWQRRGLPGTLHLPARRQFYRELAGLLLKRSRLELWALGLKEQIVAAQFGLRHGSTVFSLQEGFDPDYAGDSVGYVLRSQVLKQLISDGVRRYDFLGGIDESKKRWGAEAEHYLDLKFARPFSVGAAYLQTRRYAVRSKSWMRQNVPAVWEVLHKINVGLRRSGNKTNQAGNTPEEESEIRPQ